MGPALRLHFFPVALISPPARGFVALSLAMSQTLPLRFQVHTSLMKPKEQTMQPTQTQLSSMQKEDKTTLKKRKSTSSRAALVSMRCPTVDGYWPYLNAKETVILEVATSLCLFFKEKRKWEESCETGRVRDLLCKNILRKVHSAV